jgi:hypothetical protein
MSDVTQHLDITRLRMRAGEKPRTKVGQVRQVWPEVRNLLTAGHSLKDIWAWLNEAGINIGYARLSHCITQLRLQDRAAQTPIQDLLRGLAPAPGESPRQDLSTAQASSPTVTLDPLRNLREQRARKSGFEYDPFPTKGLTE